MRFSDAVHRFIKDKNLSYIIIPFDKQSNYKISKYKKENVFTYNGVYLGFTTDT